MERLKHFISLFAGTFQRWSVDGAGLLAAAVAYYMALAFFPVLLVLLSALGIFFEGTQSGQDAESQILETIEQQLSPSLRNNVETVFDRVRDRASIGGPVGLLSLLAASLVIFQQFDNAFDRIWNVPSKKRGIWSTIRYFFYRRLKAFVMLGALGLVIILVFVSGMALSVLLDVADQAVPLGTWGTWSVHLLVSGTLNFAVFTCIYKLVPKVQVPWRSAAAGGLLAALVWEVGRLVLSSVVIGQKYSAYGVIGAFLAIMLWAYYAASVVFLGAEFVQATSQHPPSDSD